MAKHMRSRLDLRREVEAREAHEESSDDEPKEQPEVVPRTPDAACTPEEIRQRVIDKLAQRWNETSLETESGEDDDDEPSTAAARHPTVPMPVAIDAASIQLMQTTLEERSQRRTCHFQGQIAGQEIQLSAPDEFALEISHRDPVLGVFTLSEYEPSDRDREDNCEPRGLHWEGSAVWLFALPAASLEPERATLADSFEKLPVLRDHARQLVALDRAALRDEIVDYLLSDSVDGPWWDYEERWSTFDCSDEDDEDRDLRDTERWRTLRDIFADHGLPSLLVFADGSSLLTCIHRTSFKSDVFRVHVIRDPSGQLTDAEVVCVYYGE